jgi:hypothetical protein
MTLSRIDTDPAGTALPPGHDDPAALDYVPDPLRPYWPAVELDRLDVRDACETYGTRARRDVAVATGDPAVDEWRRDVPSWRRGDVPHPGEYVEHRYGSGALPPLTDRETARAVHLATLDRAAAAHDAAVDATRSEEMRALYRCPVCSAQKPATVPALCSSCGDVADTLAREEAAARILSDGRARRDAVRDWLDRA